VREASLIAREDGPRLLNRGSGDHQVTLADRSADGGELGAESRVNAGRFHSEGDDRKPGEERFDESLTLRALLFGLGSVESMQELGSRDRRKGRLLTGVQRQEFLEIQLSPLGRDDDARVY
jgi:hypothetical protein